MAKNAWLIILVIVGVIVAMQYIGKAPSVTPSPQAGAGGNIITTNPTIAIAASDAQAGGTSVGNTWQASVGGGSFGAAGSPTLAVPGQTVALFVINGTTYHNLYVDALTVTPTTFPASVKLNKNATVTESMYTTIGLVMSNTATGAARTQNQTDLGDGATYNWKDEMQANSLTSTQDLVCLVEISAGINASSSPSGAILDGAQPVSTSKPTWYTTAGVNSNVYLFNVPALSTAATKTMNLQINAKSTGRFSAASFVKKACYTKEWFIDPNSGKATFDVADSNGNVKSMAIYSYQTYFQ